MCACRLWTNVENLVSIGQDRPTASCDSVDIELRYLNRDPSSGRFEDMLVLSTEPGDIGGL
jgi:hypothetical protein